MAFSDHQVSEGIKKVTTALVVLQLLTTADNMLASEAIQATTSNKDDELSVWNAFDKKTSACNETDIDHLM